MTWWQRETAGLEEVGPSFVEKARHGLNLIEVGHGGRRDRKRDWGVPKWRQRPEILSSATQPTWLSLAFHFGYFGGLAS